jgi:hypothetical protein
MPENKEESHEDQGPVGDSEQYGIQTSNDKNKTETRCSAREFSLHCDKGTIFPSRTQYRFSVL